jgi:hypothetical protein
MPIVQMADSPPITERDPGAPIARDAIDPDLIKLSRTRAKIGVITAAGVVALCVYFLIRLGPDRRFGGASDEPTQVAVADVVAGKIDDDAYVALDAEPLMAQAIRVVKAKGDLGWRVTPVRGTAEQMWLVLSGDGWDKPTTRHYVGRLRRIGALPFHDAIDQYATAHPRPVFATAAAVRAGFATNQIATVTGDPVAIRDADRVAFEIVDPKVSTVVVTFTGATTRKDDKGNPIGGHGPLLDASAWAAELGKLGIPAKLAATPAETDAVLGQARFDVAMPAAEVTKKLETAELWAARVDPVTRHYAATWSALRASPAGAFAIGTDVIPEAQLDLVGLYVGRAIPSDAYALITGEVPQDFWYVLPITLALAGIGLLFAWALVRAVRRDLLPTRA